MKRINVILVLNVSVLVLAVIGTLGCYILSQQLHSYEEQRDYESIILKIERSNDIRWLQNGMKLLTNQRQQITQSHIEWYKEVVKLLVFFVVISLVGVIYSVRLRRELASNKSLNSDAQKTRAG